MNAADIDPKWAWQPYEPSDKAPWDLKKAGHLHRRASFGATWDQLQATVKSGPDKAIDALLSGAPGQDEFDGGSAGLAADITKLNSGSLARAWWLDRMLRSPHPLKEKITLFWHNHFATSNAKVNDTGLILGQYKLMRRHALGSFRILLQEMSKDPAMMKWLDTAQSKKGMPNENYARELMELFSLGIGHYTETDVREAARAFTGWEIQGTAAKFSAAQHDSGEKTVLGQKGKWTGEDIVRICLEQKSAPLFISRKLFKFLVSETIEPTDQLLEPLATDFLKRDYDFGALVKNMLRSNLFFSPVVYRTRVKAPVDFALGIVRALEGRLGTTALAAALEELGQNVFYPPSVKGWDGGPAWLNGQTILFRQNLALALTSTEDTRFGRRTDPAALVRAHGKKSDDEILDFFLQLFLQGDVPADSRKKLLEYQEKSRKQTYPVYWTDEDAANHRLRVLCHLVLALPEFQLD